MKYRQRVFGAWSDETTLLGCPRSHRLPRPWEFLVQSSTHPGARRSKRPPHTTAYIAYLYEGGGSPSRPGVFELDTVRRAVIYDVSDRPELWQGSLMNLASLIQRIVYRPPGERPLRETDLATAALTRELIGHFSQEYGSFLTRYGDVVRPMPAMTADEPWTTVEEKRRRREAQEASFAREPLWGQLISRTLGGELKTLGDLERELAQQ